MRSRVEAQDHLPVGSTGNDGAAVRGNAGARRSESFLVRVSAEPREARGSRRRLTGFVSHLGSGEEANFSDVESLIAWLQKRLSEEFGRPLDDRGHASAPTGNQEEANLANAEAPPTTEHDSASKVEPAGGRPDASAPPAQPPAGGLERSSR